MDEKIDIILSRYFGGEANDAELHELDTWLSESGENEQYFDEMTSLYQNIVILDPINDNEKEKAFIEFSQYIRKDENQGKNKSRIPSFYISIAASVILIAGIFLYFNNLRPDKTVEFAASDSIKQFTIYANTEVRLETESSIKYKKGKKNEVSLEGKATFTVNSDENNNDDELLVQAGETYIKDIGTIFTVTAYPEDNYVIVQVEEGEVLFYSNDNPGISIKENEEGIYNTVTKEFELISSGMEYMEDNTGEIIFNGIKLSEITEILQSKYGSPIIIQSPYLGNLELYTSFDKDESLENIMEIISATLPINITRHENTYIITE